MKKLLMTLAGLFLAGSAYAGSLVDSAVEDTVEAAPAGSGALIPLLIIGAIIALIALGGDDQVSKKRP